MHDICFKCAVITNSMDEARVSIFDSALMFGDMAFEMARTYQRKPFRLRAHLERLYASLRLLEIDCGLTLTEIVEQARVYAQRLPAWDERERQGRGLL
jgi:branched-subunit amino acid aminotransferase/4-amino-4-deoxychorismate lyase